MQDFVRRRQRRYKTFRAEDPQIDPPPQIRKLAWAGIRGTVSLVSLCRWGQMPHYQCHGGTKQVPDLMGPPQGLAFSFQGGPGRLPHLWPQSHIKLSENPKVPVRSVNSTIVPLPPTQRDRCNKAPPLRRSRLPPLLGTSGTPTPFSSSWSSLDSVKWRRVFVFFQWEQGCERVTAGLRWWDCRWDVWAR